MRKRICLLIYNLGSGGAEHVISQWSMLLSDEYEVYMTVFDSKTKPNYEFYGKLYDLDAVSNNKNIITKSAIVLKRAYNLAKFVKKYNIDMVLSFCNECNLVNTISPHKAIKICSIRSVSDIYANRFVKHVIRSKNNSIIIQTEHLKEILIKQYGNSIKNKINIIGNPFDVELIQNKAKKELDSNLKTILETKKTIVNVASFKPPKNHVDLLRCFELVCGQIDDIYLILVGADSGGIYSDIKKMSEKSKYSDRIIFAGEYNNPFPIVANSSVFVLTSVAEGIPNALAEAMICGVPVISSNCPTGPAELLMDSNDSISYNKRGYYVGKYGVLVKPFKKVNDTKYDYTYTNEDHMFANAICDVLSSNEMYVDLKNKSKEWTSRNNLMQYKSELVRLISRCINNR